MAWWCFYFYTGWHVLKRLCKTNRNMFKNDLLPNDGGVNDLSGFLKLVYGFVLSSTCLPNRNFMNTQRPCGRMKGWEFASKDPTNINWSTAHSSEYMVSSKCWVWMAFNCVISVWTFKLWNTLGVVVGQVGCTRLAWLVCVTFVACIALIYAFKREGNRNAMSSEVTEREKERLMSARQIGAFRRRRGMNVRYTSKGFLHCGVCVCVCLCPVLSHSHWWLLWIRRWPQPFRPEVPPPNRSPRCTLM